ncbi:hypothetical protein M0804_015084 [Polistes exclamans]|nr:hypothetical protein M0804_015084 [Polistes exclamans]
MPIRCGELSTEILSAGTSTAPSSLSNRINLLIGGATLELSSKFIKVLEARAGALKGFQGVTCPADQ